jgi:hypothetical protein
MRLDADSISGENRVSGGNWQRLGGKGGGNERSCEQ